MYTCFVGRTLGGEAHSRSSCDGQKDGRGGILEEHRRQGQRWEVSRHFEVGAQRCIEEVFK